MLGELLDRSSWGAILAAEHSQAELLNLIAIVLVVGCLLAAGYMAYVRNALACGLLILVAIFSAFLLL